jgi:hypothetical protein
MTRCPCSYHRRKFLADEIGAVNLGRETGVIAEDEWGARWMLLARMQARI